MCEGDYDQVNHTVCPSVHSDELQQRFHASFFCLAVCAAHLVFHEAKAAGKVAQSTIFIILNRYISSLTSFVVSSQKSLTIWLTLWTRLTAGFATRRAG